MPVRHLQGDLLASGADVIFHGCNCFNTMGAGIARVIKHALPYAYEQDQRTPRGDVDKLGMVSIAVSPGAGLPIVANLYTQYYPGRHFVLSALSDSLLALRNYLDKVDPEHKFVIAGPRIGCGIGGGDWEEVETVIDNVFPDRPIYIYTYEAAT